jgi:hypothetical protein
MSWKDRPWPGFRDGWMSERSNLTDWLEGIGETFVYSGWSETALMLTKAELPGVYVDLAREMVMSIDHVDARILDANKRQLVVELSNITRYDATVKVLAENIAQAGKPLLNNAALAWQRVLVPAGKKVIRKASYANISFCDRTDFSVSNCARQGDRTVAIARQADQC